MSEQKTRIAVISIIIEDKTCVAQVNELLHSYSTWIIGRMGIPYPSKNVSIISVAMDAPADAISALTGKIGKLEGATVKTAYAKV